MHPRVSRILAERGIARERFERALAEAVRLAGDEAEVSARMQLCAALCAEPGGRLVDVGGSVSFYLVVLRQLGMEITVVDTLPYLEVEHLQIGGFKDKTLRRIALFEKLGIAIDRRDAFSMTLPSESYDVACAFETIEHFPQSPKPVLAQMRDALVPGGRMCISVPNIARLQARMRLLLGTSPHERYAYYFHNGNPFYGHHREMTVQEVGYIPGALEMETVRLFSSDIPYESMKAQNALKKAALAFSNATGITDWVLPRGFHKHVWLEARKPAASKAEGVEAVREPMSEP
jgi:SAM-dependent methyltransferase